MQIAASVDQIRYDVFRWRYELSIPKKLALAIGIAGLAGLLAQLRGSPICLVVRGISSDQQGDT